MIGKSLTAIALGICITLFSGCATPKVYFYGNSIDSNKSNITQQELECKKYEEGYGPGKCYIAPPSVLDIRF